MRKKVASSSSTVSPRDMEKDEEYQAFEKQILYRIADYNGPLFTTTADPDKLWTLYLRGLPVARRQHYNCNACKSFIKKYGGLVKIHAGGYVEPLAWPVSAPKFFQKSVNNLRDYVSGSSVTGVFYHSEVAWGAQHTISKHGVKWSHLHGINSMITPDESRIITDSQAMAEKVEEFGMLNRALGEYTAQQASEAIRILKSDSLGRPEKAVECLEWFAERFSDNTNQRWLAIATAPPGFAHIKNNIGATLMDDVKAGVGFEEIKRRWEEKMHPLRYQRPIAQPKQGTIDAAEKLVEKMGIERSFERRYATLDDIKRFLWVKAREPKEASGFFGHLRGHNISPSDVGLPQRNMTWEKFRREVLPGAGNIDISLPQWNGPYYGLLAATHADSPNLLQWDNPVSWYFYHGGSSSSDWGLANYMGALPRNDWGEVTAVFLPPYMWDGEDKFIHHGRKVFFAIRGAVDRRHSSGLCLFPEIMKSEYHGIRSVIEAHSNAKKPTGGLAGNANGLAFQNGGPPITLRVDGQIITIDRWD